MRLAVLAQEPDGPVVRHRVLALAPWLREAGFGTIDVHAIPKRLHQRVALFGSLRDADVVLLLRKLFTYAELRVLRAAARRLVFDFDDAVMFRDPWRGRPVSHVRRRRFRHTVRAADLVLAGNAYLLEIAREDAPDSRAVLAPTPIDVDSYSPGAAPSPLPFRVGWIGSRATRAYLGLVADALREVHRQRPDLVVPVMADAPPAELDGLPVEFVPWSEQGEVPFLRSLHIGLMPLSDDPFSRGKCGFKLLQYMACGVPAVASPVGVNVDLCDSGRTAIAATGTADWVTAILRLADDREFAAELAAAARERVVVAWSTRAFGPAYAAALSSGDGGQQLTNF